MKKTVNLVVVILTSTLFSGCWFSVGNSQGLCESGQCNYKEAGVCAGVIDIYKNRHSLKNRKVTERWYWFDDK